MQARVNKLPAVLSRDLARFGMFGEAEIWSHDSFPNLICKNLGLHVARESLPHCFVLVASGHDLVFVFEFPIITEHVTDCAAFRHG